MAGCEAAAKGLRLHDTTASVRNATELPSCFLEHGELYFNPDAVMATHACGAPYTCLCGVHVCTNGDAFLKTAGEFVDCADVKAQGLCAQDDFRQLCCLALGCAPLLTKNKTFVSIILYILFKQRSYYKRAFPCGTQALLARQAWGCVLIVMI